MSDADKVTILIVGGPCDGRRERFKKPLLFSRKIPFLNGPRFFPAEFSKENLTDVAMARGACEAVYYLRRVHGPAGFVEIYVHEGVSEDELIPRLVAGYLAISGN